MFGLVMLRTRRLLMLDFFLGLNMLVWWSRLLCCVMYLVLTSVCLKQGVGATVFVQYALLTSLDRRFIPLALCET